MTDDKMTEQESLQLISQMINKAKNNFHESGVGPILWGTIITVCSLVTYFQIKFHFDLPFDIWILTVAAIVPQLIIVSRERKRQKVRSYDDITMDYIWMTFGISIFLLVTINNVIITKLTPVFNAYVELKGRMPDENYSGLSTSFFLLLYGFPTIITGGSRHFKPMLFGGIFCWIACVISLFTKSDIDMLLLAASAILAWLIPGILLRKKYKSIRAANV